VIQTEQRRTVG